MLFPDAQGTDDEASEQPALAAMGGRVDSPSNPENPKASKKAKKQAAAHRQLHDVLGGDKCNYRLSVETSRSSKRSSSIS